MRPQPGPLAEVLSRSWTSLARCGELPAMCWAVCLAVTGLVQPGQVVVLGGEALSSSMVPRGEGWPLVTARAKAACIQAGSAAGAN